MSLLHIQSNIKQKTIEGVPLWLVLTIIALCTILCSIQIYVGRGITFFYDSVSYFQAVDDLKILHPHLVRTPAYPLLYLIVDSCFGQPASMTVMAIIQWGCYSISLILLFPICQNIGIGRKISCWVIIGCNVFPGMWVMNNLFMAESLCSSFLVFLVWLSIELYKSKTLKWLYISGVTVCILVFGKPVFIIIIPIISIFWALCLKGVHQLLKVSFTTLVIISFVIFYAWNLSRYNGGNIGLTIATVNNQFYCLREDGLIRPNEIPVDSIRERFTPYYEADPKIHAPGHFLYANGWDDFNWSEKKLMVEIALKKHPKEALRGTWQRFKDSATFSATAYPEPREKPVYDTFFYYPPFSKPFFFPFYTWWYTPIWLSWLLLFIYLISLTKSWVRTKQMPTIGILIGVILFAGMFTSIVGAQDSWGRLITPFNLMLVPITGFLIQKSTCIAAISKWRNNSKI